MFERLVSQLLEGYLGRYIDIQKEQLKILLWNAEVSYNLFAEEVLLEKVELRIEAFDYLQLPFSLKQGQVGRLSIKIPWKKLGWDPINISLEDIFVLASQRDDSEWNLDLVERRELAGKKAKLNAAELAKLSKRVSDNRAGHSFISYISAKAKFTFGMRFSSLSVVTDSRVKQNYSGASTGKLKGGQVNKIVEISTLGIYCNMHEEYPTFSGTNNHTDFQQPCNANSNPEDDDYIIPPFDATVFLMVILLKEVQLQQIMSLWDYFSTCALRERYGRYRPCRSTLTMKLDGWQKRWWRYAQESVLADVRRKLKRTSWSYLGQRMSFRRSSSRRGQGTVACGYLSNVTGSQFMRVMDGGTKAGSKCSDRNEGEGNMGDVTCVLCGVEPESVEYLFVNCLVSRQKSPTEVCEFVQEKDGLLLQEQGIRYGDPGLSAGCANREEGGEGSFGLDPGDGRKGRNAVAE
ncbi:hypothetical protein QJS10_CPA10g00685 [Acorus calamus]|uniref:Chorein N-terminal domain-containing protein n=1 Tax=Acorus calamus TaxID=4465 RepID=A0AAV9DX46_ACOCL|nr:hypothetical protein QJS10_CPA10g00685 [Acorus calamus]